ncbi:MAG TPA: hypothetical protein VML00_02630, partial [Bacteroidota bacterium]|nr:hypothetical protein [Bacteroidota bacterium]
MKLDHFLPLLFIPPVLALPSPQTAETQDEPAQDTTTIPAARPSPDSLGFSRGIEQSFFTHFPGRGIEAALAAGPGIAVSRTGLLLMRGEYESAITLTLEGAVVNDPTTGGIAVPVTAEAIEHIDVSADGPVSRPGGSGSGLVELRYRTGGRERWGGSLLVETDRYTGMNNRSLGGYSYGYSDWTGTIGGPVPGTGNALSVFAALQNTFYRDPTVSLRSGYSFTGANAIVTGPVITPAHADARPDTLNIAFPEGNAPGGQYNNWNLTGSSLLDLGTMQIRLAGSYSTSRAQDPADLFNVFNQSRLPIEIAGSGFLSAGLRHTVSCSLRYDIGVSFRSSTSVREDPQLLDDLFSYGDPAANAALGYAMSVVGNQSMRWPAYSLWEAFSVNQPGTQVAMFQKRAESAYGAHGSVTIDVGAHALSAGGEYSRSSLRMLGPVDAFPWWTMRNNVPDPATLERLL